MILLLWSPTHTSRKTTTTWLSTNLKNVPNFSPAIDDQDWPHHHKKNLDELLRSVLKRDRLSESGHRSWDMVQMMEPEEMLLFFCWRRRILETLLCSFPWLGMARDKILMTWPEVGQYLVTICSVIPFKDEYRSEL